MLQVLSFSRLLFSQCLALKLDIVQTAGEGNKSHERGKSSFFSSCKTKETKPILGYKTLLAKVISSREPLQRHQTSAIVPMLCDNDLQNICSSNWLSY